MTTKKTMTHQKRLNNDIHPKVYELWGVFFKSLFISLKERPFRNPELP